jgi:apolipoprotein D and lipocalin family protein
MVIATLAALGGCASTSDAPPGLQPLTVVEHVDLKRFMGNWFVIANIPTFLEKGAHNAMDHYRLDADGTVFTTFSFNAQAPDGPLKRYTSRGFVLDTTSNAVWGQQYIWPIKADYRIAYLSRDYNLVVVARQKRDYVWIMARTPEISELEYQRLVGVVGSLGYDVTKLLRVPQLPEPAAARALD